VVCRHGGIYYFICCIIGARELGGLPLPAYPLSRRLQINFHHCPQTISINHRARAHPKRPLRQNVGKKCCFAATFGNKLPASERDDVRFGALKKWAIIYFNVTTIYWDSLFLCWNAEDL
jgi:hypothetical protein